MLRIFKSYTLKTSLLDDFMYYENRQRILQEERARILRKSYENPYLVPQLDPPRKQLQYIHDFPSTEDVNGTGHDANKLIIINKNKVSEGSESDCSVKNHSAPTGQVALDTKSDNLTSSSENSQVPADGVPNGVDELELNSLTIHSDKLESVCPLPTAATAAAVSSTAKREPVKVVTIGSMPVKVAGNESSGFLTVGTIPLDPRALERD